MKSFKFYINEDAKSKINKLRNLSRSEKKRLITFFSNNRQLESEIDWNNKNLDITDFQVVLHTPSKTKTKKAVKSKGISGLIKNVDYVDISYMFENHYAYVPLDHEASVHIANKYIGKCTGEWCTAYAKNDNFWKNYTDTERYLPIYLISHDGYEKYAWLIKAIRRLWTIYDKNNNRISTIPNENEYKIFNKNKKTFRELDKKHFKRKVPEHWIYKADTLNMHMRLDGKHPVWKAGIWKDGTWEDGTWEYGVWEKGTWEDGLWKDGTWYNGTWENGIWEKGTWKRGTWERGYWEDGTWENGIWEGGYDKNGKFHPAGDSPDKW